MKKDKTILFTIPTLDSLGAQRVLLTILKYINLGPDYKVKLLVISKTGEFKNEIPEHIDVIIAENYILGIPKIRVLELLFYGYFKALKQISPDIVISLVPFTNFACFFSKFFFGLKYKLIISEHAHVTGAISDKQNMGNFFQKIYLNFFKYIYNSRLVNKIIVIAEESKDDLILNHNIIPSKLFLINNPVDITLIREKAKIEPKDKWFKNFKTNNNFIIINSGRLVFQKRQDLLIRAFAEVYKQNKSVRLVILGAGNSNYLLKLINDLNLSSVIKLAGFKSNPFSYISRSNLFVLSSCWEGLPCVIAETMALNIPIVSTKCPSGPKEMLENGRLGFLAEVDDVFSIAGKINEAIASRDNLDKITKIASEQLFRYEPRYITKKYENLILSNLN